MAAKVVVRQGTASSVWQAFWTWLRSLVNLSFEHHVFTLTHYVEFYFRIGFDAGNDVHNPFAAVDFNIVEFFEDVTRLESGSVSRAIA